MKNKLLLTLLPAGLSLSGCTTEELAMFADAMEQAAYESQYNTYYSPYGATYGTPYGAGYGGYGSWVGYNQCRYTGSFYTCDTDANGYADMYGDTDDGSYASSNLRVNGRGEAYTWDSNRGEWKRNPAYDSPSRYGDHDHHRDRDHDHDHDRDGRY